MNTKMQLGQIGLGVVEEKFSHELGKVIVNISDPNTEIDKAREITIKFKIKPDKERRDMCSMTASVVSKMAPAMAYVSRIACGVNPQTGEIGVEELITGNLFHSPVESEKITTLKTKEA